MAKLFLFSALFFIYMIISNCKVENGKVEGLNNQLSKGRFTNDSLENFKQLPMIDSKGVIVWKKKNKKLITLLDSNFNNLFFDYFNKIKINKIKPFAFHGDNYLLVFRCLGSIKDYFKIIINEDTNEIGYVNLKDLTFKYESWEEHIMHVFSIGIINKTDLKNNPNEPSSTNKYVDWNDVYFKPIEFQNDWLKVSWEDSTGSKQYAWVRWRAGNKLLIELFYFS